jgi:hypothetical protein
MKSVLAGAVVLGMLFASTAAHAETVRAANAFPGVISAKKVLLARTLAPKKRESKVKGSALPIAIVGTTVVAVGIVSAVDDNGTPVS